MGISSFQIAARTTSGKAALMFELRKTLTRTLYLITLKGTAAASGVKQFTDFVTRFFETA